MELELKMSDMPPILACVLGGALVAIFAAQVINVSHVADEFVMMGCVLGVLFFIGGGYAITTTYADRGGGAGW